MSIPLWLQCTYLLLATSSRIMLHVTELKSSQTGFLNMTMSSLSVGHSESRRMTDELGSRQRDLSTSSVTKRANGHWHAIIASSCRWSQREYKRQPVHRINHPFASEPSGGVHYCSSWRYEKLTSAGVTAQQRWSRSHGRTTVREDSHTGVCGGQLPCVLQH